MFARSQVAFSAAFSLTQLEWKRQNIARGLWQPFGLKKAAKINVLQVLYLNGRKQPKATGSLAFFRIISLGKCTFFSWLYRNKAST
jgi:hypothetical protein